MKNIVLLGLTVISLNLSNISFSQTWLPAMQTGVDDAATVFTEAIIEYQGDIIIAGEFASVSGVPAVFVARWNGTSWSAMGTGLPAVARCLAIYNNELYAGLDNIGASTLYKWSGTAWVASGPFQDPISTLYVDPVSNTFYAGGFFTSPGKYVAKLSGTTWSGVGNLPAGSSSFPGVNAISVFNNQLYVGGTFGGGTSTQYCAKYNGTSFVQIHSNQPNNGVNAFAQKDNKLYLGGAFSRVGPSGTPFTPSVIGWDGTNWIPLTNDQSGPISSFGGVESLVVYKNQLYAAGSFDDIFNTGVTVNNIARWDDCKWLNLDDGNGTIGLNDAGKTLTVIGNDLYIGGEFTQAGSVLNSKRIAAWNTAIVASAAPTANVTINGNTLTVDQTGATYQWLNCATGNSAISGANNQSFSATQSGVYAVLVTLGSCTATSSCTTYNFADLEDLESNFKLNLYPNPSTGIFNIETNINQVFSLKIIDIYGKLIFEKIIQNSASTIDLSSEASGIYFVQLNVGDKNIHHRIIKE